MTEISESVVLVGRTLTGRTNSWEIKGDQLIAMPGSELVSQRVRTVDGTTLVRRSLPDELDDAKRLLLDNEIRALARLTHAFPATGPFPALVGYDMDSPDPWALTADWRGVPASDVVGGLLRAGLEQFAGSLFQAVAYLGTVEVVHTALRLDSLYLDGTSPQIVTFEHAAFFGEPRDDGRGPALAQHDVLAAGKVLYEAFTGVAAPPGRVDLADVAWLGARLPDVFGELNARPSAIDVVQRLGTGAVPVPAVHDELRAGRAEFDEARQRKMPPQPETVRTFPVRPPQQKVKLPAHNRVLLIAGALVVIALLVFVIVGGLS
ncbi:hypothetical protein DMH04_45810 [Kibdelosporangium aridum]|uniref:Protein kinase domain-containing protein n=1 Tax=Kibdelosporangium aridum TaxID=2030 RepID=A0A428YNP7_KIBAR|nr:hypothetical protein [Kibdelosporangium aridum]RSM69641.1 hypothetical protein DMH04_45810 [Kibdelosporangium aridum]